MVECASGIRWTIAACPKLLNIGGINAKNLGKLIYFSPCAPILTNFFIYPKGPQSYELLFQHSPPSGQWSSWLREEQWEVVTSAEYWEDTTECDEHAGRAKHRVSSQCWRCQDVERRQTSVQEESLFISEEESGYELETRRQRATSFFLCLLEYLW